MDYTTVGVAACTIASAYMVAYAVDALDRHHHPNNILQDAMPTASRELTLLFW